MSHFRKFFFHLCMVLSVSGMIYGHALIINSGRWFIPGKERYNVFTRWVSDFAAVWPQGMWIKAAILLFCAALFIFKNARIRSCGSAGMGQVHRVWNSLISFSLIAGLLLVVLYDMSPPQYSVKEPSWLGKIFGDRPRLVERSRDSTEYLKQWHHQVGFRMFIISFALTLFTAAWEKIRIKDIRGVIRDALFLIFTAAFMLWLFKFHTSLPGIPQRALLVLIFWWVWREGAALHKPRTATQPN